MQQHSYPSHSMHLVLPAWPLPLLEMIDEPLDEILVVGGWTMLTGCWMEEVHIFGKGAVGLGFGSWFEIGEV